MKLKIKTIKSIKIDQLNSIISLPKKKIIFTAKVNTFP